MRYRLTGSKPPAVKSKILLGKFTGVRIRRTYCYHNDSGATYVNCYMGINLTKVSLLPPWQKVKPATAKTEYDGGGERMGGNKARWPTSSASRCSAKGRKSAEVGKDTTDFSTVSVLPVPGAAAISTAADFPSLPLPCPSSLAFHPSFRSDAP